MKGYLFVTKEGWFVVYDQRTFQDPSAEDGILPVHPESIADTSFNFYHGKEVEFEINMYDGKSHISNAWNGYAKLIDYDENGKPLTYWGGLKDRTCDHTNCREVCPECQISPIKKVIRIDDINEEADKLIKQNEVSSSKTEISDEEITKLANEYILYNDSKRQWVIEGMKLYREQQKKK